jgi:2-C-methyl-D-erythritol 4-phosphate cytidylyltransferase
MNKTAVIVAGGSGLRMGSEIPKQFLPLQGKPLLWHTLNTFLQAFDDMQIILVLPEAHLPFGETLLEAFPKQSIQLTAGGETRFHSVQNGLALVQEPAIVFVHDGVRCLLTTDLIQRCYHQAVEKGSAIPVVSATDSIRWDNGQTHQPVNRDQIKLVQTPQTFRSNIILPAFQQPYSDHFTDEATVAEAAGFEVQLIEGEYNNLKVTRPLDLLLAEHILAHQP